MESRKKRLEHLYKAGARLARSGGTTSLPTTYARQNGLKDAEALAVQAGWLDEMSKAPADRRGRLGLTRR